jgi:threonine dehydrogenase-like Zn-dependent dehydrogenase
MRASRYRGDRVFETEAASLPVARPDEALLRVRRVGICGTDLHIYQGHLDHRVPKNGVIGHEIFAEVVAAPAGAEFGEGDRVVVEPLIFCGTCRACRMGATYLCYHLKVMGVDAPGGMQEYWAVPTARLLKVPDVLTDDRAALIEPLAIATHDVARAPIGCLIALVCRHRGARVKVVEVNPYRIAMLENLGLETIGGDQDVVRLVNDWTGGEGADVSFEVTGHPAAVRLMTDVVRVWGTVNVIAIHAEPVPVNLYPIFARELTLLGSRLYTRGAWEEAIRLASTGAIDVGALVTRSIPLEQLQNGMEELLAGGPAMKVLVNLDG